MRLTEFNAAPDAALTAALLACCDVPAWAEAVRAGRPYPDVATLLSSADAAARQFGPDDVSRALAGHPRIGERAPDSTLSAAWSRQEQSEVSTDNDTGAALAAGNAAYEERFGRVFLICASGLRAEQVLAALHTRLDHDEATENTVVAEELRKITLLRLERLVTP